MSELAEKMQFFMPHGHCYLWLPSVLWLHVLADAAIAAAYFSIPFALHVFVRRRRDLQFRWIFVLFAGFIFWCGLTHIMSIWVVWRPDYVVEGLVKLVTALISVVTAVLIWPLIPRALALPSPESLRSANQDLRAEIARRERAETELRETNRNLEERVAELESFSYTVSHDLRAPLRAIDGFANLLTLDHTGNLDADGRHLLERVSAAARRMSALIDGLLAFVRLGSVPMQAATIDMRQLALDAAEAARVDYPNVAFTVEALPPARGDATTVAQIWNNLVDNAFKFSAGSPGPGVTIGAERDVAGEVVYMVRDNGVGFDMQYARNLFRVFYRLHDAGEFAGTGIGLATVKRIVERHGGRVWAEATTGGGAIFRFSLGRAPVGTAAAPGAAGGLLGVYPPAAPA